MNFRESPVKSSLHPSLIEQQLTNEKITFFDMLLFAQIYISLKTLFSWITLLQWIIYPTGIY